MLFFGIDPSFSETGISVIDEEGFHDTVTCRTANKDLDEDRILAITHGIMEFLLDHEISKDHTVYIEGLAYSRISSSTHRLAGLHYYLRTRLHNAGFKFSIVPPSTLKKFVLGKHNKKGTKKQQMLLYIYKRWGQEFLNDNKADAFALAQYGRYQNGYGKDSERTTDE